MKSYGRAFVVGPIDFSVPPGTTTALIGPSGAGKSTLLRMLNGLIWPDSGTVRFRGRPLVTGELQEIRRQIGYVVQGGALFPHLDVRDNVALVARRLGDRLGGLAPMTRFDLQEDLRDAFARLKQPAVMVTHDLAEAAFLAAQAVLLRDGRLVQQAPVEELALAPADEFVARFVRAHRRSP